MFFSPQKLPSVTASSRRNNSTLLEHSNRLNGIVLSEDYYEMVVIWNIFNKPSNCVFEHLLLGKHTEEQVILEYKIKAIHNHEWI